jgi:Tol biopolymer transport system component
LNLLRNIKECSNFIEAMKRNLVLSALTAITFAVYGQQPDKGFPVLKGPYLGQQPPGQTPELFATGIVSTGEGVHGNIVFTTDSDEAAWHPNYKVNGKSLIYIMKYQNGKWEVPIEFFLKDGYNYSEPFYSHDGKRLFYLSGEESASGNAQNERIYYVERKGEEWSDPKLLSQNLPAFHWQFSLDRDNNLYYGGKSTDKKGEIYYSQFTKGEYLTPERLPETINSESPEFSPFISPDNTYLVFVRMLEQQNSPPKTNLFVSFKDKNGNWTQAQNLSAKLRMSDKTPVEMMGAPRISPDGKYLFFCSFNGKGHMAYWVSANIIEELRIKK